MGGIASFIISFWMLVGQILNKNANQPLPTPTYNCLNETVTTTEIMTSHAYETTEIYMTNDTGIHQWEELTPG